MFQVRGKPCAMAGKTVFQVPGIGSSRQKSTNPALPKFVLLCLEFPQGKMQDTTPLASMPCDQI
jgi:hypothetical protein